MAKLVLLVGIVFASASCHIIIVKPKKHADAGPSNNCAPCVSNADCPGGSCVQIDGDDSCAEACTTDADCESGDACGSANASDGSTVRACIPKSGSCSGSGGCGTCAGGQVCDPTTGSCVDPPPADGCGTLIGPSGTAQCSCNSSTHDCQSNGCYGGWYCDTASNKCQAPPSDCGGGLADAPDAGPISGSVDATGGTVSRMFFAVVGDTRPPDTNQTSQYPTSTITQIYQDIDALNPKPQFVLTTGDYMFSSKNGTANAPQLAKYTSAAANYHGGPVFPVVGNHECTGYTADNCGSTTTANLAAFKSALVEPLGLDLFYTVPFNASDGSWNAKLVVAACNAWSSSQKSWLQGELAKPTTYTIVARHEPSSATTAPCIAEMDPILQAASPQIDLLIVGHTHTFEHSGHEIVVGNGGAPLTGSAPFGFATFELIPGTGFRVSEFDASTNAILRSFVVTH